MLNWLRRKIGNVEVVKHVYCGSDQCMTLLAVRREDGKFWSLGERVWTSTLNKHCMHHNLDFIEWAIRDRYKCLATIPDYEVLKYKVFPAKPYPSPAKRGAVEGGGR